MKITTLCRLALLGASALLAWPATAPWADTNPNFNPNVTATTPDTDFTLDDVNGTAYHQKTGLTWKRCAEGQTWSSGTCTGTAGSYTWSLALQRGPALGAFAGFSDWRLPNQKELNSIVEQRNYSPAINATVFPNAPASYFWSASPYAPYAGYAWLVVFNLGDGYADSKGANYAVRLVRGGQYALLSVVKAGGGSGAVTSNLPGIDCGPFCKGSFANEMYTAGAVVLTATPDANSDFGGWAADCPSASGAECTVNATGDRTVTATFTPKAVACATSWNTGALQFKLIGISCDTGTNNTVRTIFGDDLDPNAYYNDWYLWKVDPVTNASVGVGLDDVLQPQQQGYWMKTRTNVTVDVAGTVTAPPALETGAGCPTANGCFPSPLTPPDASETKQNNLVGHPFPYAVKWADMRFVVNGTAYTPSAAQTATYAAKTFWRYNGSSYNTYDDTTPGVSNTWWQANEGLFVRLLPSARSFTGTKLWTPALQAQLLSAPLAADATEPAAERAIRAAGGVGKARGEAEQKAHRAAHGQVNEGLDSGNVAGREWYVRLIVAAPAETLEDAGNLLGQLADAQTGFDEHDLPELPPPEFGPFLSLVFPHPEWGQLDADYGTDYHPLSRGRQQDSWTFEIRSNDPGRDLVLSWQGPMAILARSVLVDLATGQTIPAVKGSYPIGALGGDSRAFEWRYNVPPGQAK